MEKNNNIDGKIKKLNDIKLFNLTEKIRSNEEIYNFFQGLFNNKRTLKKSGDKNIQLNYFKGIESARNYVGSLDSAVWTYLQFAPSCYDWDYYNRYSVKDVSKVPNSHKIIGQEFDQVVIVIDEFFTYSNNGDFSCKEELHYSVEKMLFQNITRVRKN